MDRSIISENVFLCQQYALALQAQGFCLLPLHPKNKIPYKDLLPLNNGQPSWSVYTKKPPTAADIKAWFKHDPDLNIGIMTGVKGLYILDIDHKPPSDINLPVTVAVKTGRGWHYYFTCNKEIRTCKFKFGSLQGKGAYVVAPGSVHPSGKLYEYADSLALGEVEIAQLPDWLRDGRNRKKHSQDPSQNSRAARAAQPTTGPLNPPFNTPRKSVVRNDSITCYTFDGVDPERVSLFGDDGIATDIMRLCGRDIEHIGKVFKCPLPGHDEKKPSASLYKKPGGLIMMQDFHSKYKLKNPSSYTDDAGIVKWWPLPDVYAATVTGKALLLGKGERVIWGLRALHQAGYVEPPTIRRYALPEDKKLKGVLKGKPYTIKADIVNRLYNGFVYLMELRQLYEPQDSAPFSWTFAAGWCGIGSMATIQKALNWLLQNGYLYDARPKDKREGLTLFKLGKPRKQKEVRS